MQSSMASGRSDGRMFGRDVHHSQGHQLSIVVGLDMRSTLSFLDACLAALCGTSGISSISCNIMPKYKPWRTTAEDEPRLHPSSLASAT